MTISFIFYSEILVFMLLAVSESINSPQILPIMLSIDFIVRARSMIALRVSLSCNAVHASLSEFLLEMLSGLLLTYASAARCKSC